MPGWLLPTLAFAAMVYRIWAILHLGLDTYVDEAYYWGWAQSLDWGYYSKPPVIAGLISLSGSLFGDNLLALKAPSLVLYPATAWVIQQFGRQLFGERVGFWAGLAYLTLPFVSTVGLFVSTDAPLLFFWAVGMWLLWRALERNNAPVSTLHTLCLWSGVGMTVGLGLMSKYTMAAFFGSALLALLARPGGWRELGRPGPWLAATVALALFIPNLWWNWQHGFPTFQHTAEITLATEQRGWHLDQLLEFTAGQWASFGPLMFLGLLWALLRPRYLWSDTRTRFLLLFLLPLLALVSLQALTGRANGNWAAPIFVPACLLTLAFLGQEGTGLGRAGWRLARSAVALNILVAVAIYQWPDVLTITGHAMTARNDPFKRARGWHALAEGVRPHLAAHPDAVLVSNDRELMAQLIYGLRPTKYARWQPQPHIEDHYGLTAPLTQPSIHPVLFVVAHGSDLSSLTSRFDSADKLAEVDVEVYTNLHRQASVWLMQGFKGYTEIKN